MKAVVLASGLWMGAGVAMAAGPLAFPGAEGFGAGATGGRGGATVHVTNLDDDGPGSLREAVSEPNRTVVFDVGGIIPVKSQIALSDNLTVAGQTAPGGIIIYGGGISISKHKNVIVRYLTVRSGIKTGRGSKSLSVLNGENIIVDHLTIGWGRWDNAGFTGKCTDMTMQNCMLEEAIKDQQFGMIIDGARRVSIVRNLWIDNHGRNPKGKGDLQYINNVIYNWGNQGFGGGHSGAPWHQDLIGNYMIAGPSSSEHFFSFLTANDIVYSEGNFVDLDKDGVLNGRPWTAQDLSVQNATAAPKAYNNPTEAPVHVTSAQQAVADAIAGAGNSLHRDPVDQRLIEQLRSFGKSGENPDSEADVGGMPTLPMKKGPVDTDGDGIPDAWEAAHGLNPKDPADAQKVVDGGYTQLEIYLNGLVAKP
ncbi:MAG: pectate lyase family protein [Tepidisphaeraceae bacterium]